MDLLDTHVDLLDADTPSKHFVSLQDVLKTSWRRVFKTSCEMSWKTKNCYAEGVLKSSRRLEDQQMSTGREVYLT